MTPPTSVGFAAHAADGLRAAKSHSDGTGIFTGLTTGGSTGGVAKGDDHGEASTWNEYDADSSGTSSMSIDSEGESESESHTSNWSKSHVPMQIPKMGKELMHRAYEPIADQRFRAMAALHDQKQRQFVARIVEKQIPVSVLTPTVNQVPYNELRVKSYLQKQLDQWPFVLPSVKVEKQIKDREDKYAGELLTADEPVAVSKKIEGKPGEPVAVRRRIQ